MSPPARAGEIQVQRERRPLAQGHPARVGDRANIRPQAFCLLASPGPFPCTLLPRALQRPQGSPATATPSIPEAWWLCLVAFLHSPFSRPGPSPSPGPLRVRAEALRGLRSPAPSPAALNKNLIKCRGRPPPGLGRPDHRAGFLLQTAQLGLRRPCVCMERAPKPPLRSPPHGLSSQAVSCILPLPPACSSDHPRPVSVSPLLLFLLSSQPGCFCLFLSWFCRHLSFRPLFFLGVWFPISALESCLLSCVFLCGITILLPQKCALLLSSCLGASFTLWLSSSVSPATRSPLGAPHSGPLSHPTSPSFGLFGLL